MATAGFTFGGHPLPLFTPVGGPVESPPPAVVVVLAFFGGLPRGRPVLIPEVEVGDFVGGGGAAGSLGLGGRPLGLGDETAVSGGRGSLGFGGRPRPRRGGPSGSGFM